jgi:hypothetical protein
VSDLDVIKPAAVAAEFNGKQVHIAPLKVGQLPAFARAIKPLGGAIEDIATGRKALGIASLLELIADHADAVIDATAIGSGLTRAEIEDGSPDQLVELAAKVLKVNADFFKGRLTPEVVAAAVKVMGQPGGGLTP